MPDAKPPKGPPLEKRERVDEGEYVVAIAVAGEHKGRIGYIDDYAPEGAIVYFEGPPSFGPYSIVPLEHLRRATDEEAEWWNEHEANDLKYAQAAREARKTAPVGTHVSPDGRAITKSRLSDRGLEFEMQIRTRQPLGPRIKGRVRPRAVYDATAIVMIRSGDRVVFLERECVLPFVPQMGMALQFGSEDAGFVCVEEVAYYADDMRLLVHCSPEERLYVEEDDGPVFVKDPLEQMPGLVAAGFTVTSDENRPIKKNVSPAKRSKARPRKKK